MPVALPGSDQPEVGDDRALEEVFTRPVGRVEHLRLLGRRSDDHGPGVVVPPGQAAIGDLLASFVKAYNGKDAKALGALFTADAEIEDEDGSLTRG